MDKNFLITLAETYAAHRRLKLSTVSTYAAHDGKFFGRLKADAGVTLAKADAVLRWFSTHWPDDLAWPRDIPRPAKSKAAA